MISKGKEEKRQLLAQWRKGAGTTGTYISSGPRIPNCTYITSLVIIVTVMAINRNIPLLRAARGQKNRGLQGNHSPLFVLMHRQLDAKGLYTLPGLPTLFREDGLQWEPKRKSVTRLVRYPSRL